MADELNLAALVRAFQGKDYSLLERIILSHDGTVQALLSVIWREPVEVRVLDQIEHLEEGKGVIVRLVDLEAGDLVVARARSRIPVGKNGTEVVDDVRSRSLGLGQIAAVHGLSPRRTLLDHGVSEDCQTFWRKYEMAATDPDLYFEIQEMFPRALYQGLVETWRWPRAQIKGPVT